MFGEPITLFNSISQVVILMPPNPLGTLGLWKVSLVLLFLPSISIWELLFLESVQWMSYLATVHGLPRWGHTAFLPWFLQKHQPYKAQVWGSEKNYGTKILNIFKVNNRLSYSYKHFCLITSKSSMYFHKLLILTDQREDRMKTTVTES